MSYFFTAHDGNRTRWTGSLTQASSVRIFSIEE